jgi:hypothetical protein
VASQSLQRLKQNGKSLNVTTMPAAIRNEGKAQKSRFWKGFAAEETLTRSSYRHITLDLMKIWPAPGTTHQHQSAGAHEI